MCCWFSFVFARVPPSWKPVIFYSYHTHTMSLHQCTPSWLEHHHLRTTPRSPVGKDFSRISISLSSLLFLLTAPHYSSLLLPRGPDGYSLHLGIAFGLLFLGVGDGGRLVGDGAVVVRGVVYVGVLHVTTTEAGQERLWERKEDR